MNTEHFKKLLEKEKHLLETELKSVGQINPSNPKDWEATAPKEEVLGGDFEEVAEKIEGYEENTAILKQLEIKLNEVRSALGRIDTDSYGKCSVCGKEIEEKRLEANPSATTCIEHMK